ncbi:MAG TPA: fibronectin type III domain-containing protein [Candidatus Aquilonibacter sp.]|nr:fibronectin type III domain-containing protein [Candidatus Aquilonibacter sp.]
MQLTLKKNNFCNLIFLFALLTSLHRAAAASVSLAWNPSSDTNVVGYNVYYGTTSGDYTGKVQAGNVSAITISNLTCGTTYYFAATAFDSAGNESGFSNEAQFIVPGVLALSAGANPGDPAVIKFPVAPSHWYEIQASTDLHTWTTIGQTAVETTNEWVQFSDPDASEFSSRFYRLVLH